MRSISDLLNPCSSLCQYPNLSASACLIVPVKPVSPHWLKLYMNTNLLHLGLSLFDPCISHFCALAQQALPEYRQFYLAVWNRFCWKVVHFANQVCNMVWTVDWLYNSITCPDGLQNPSREPLKKPHFVSNSRRQWRPPVVYGRQSAPAAIGLFKDQLPTYTNMCK